jgi:hypothetical protein
MKNWRPVTKYRLQISSLVSVQLFLRYQNQQRELHAVYPPAAGRHEGNNH